MEELKAESIHLIDGTTFIETINKNPDQFEEIIIKENIIEDIFVGSFIITAYCPCEICCGEYSNISSPTTSSGVIAKSNHTISADITILPYQTEVIIAGQSYVVEDTGGAIKGNRIDMFFNTHYETLEYGKKIENVYIKKEREVITVLKPVEFIEYMNITGNLMKNNIAESHYNNKNGNVTWKDKQGNILAARNNTQYGFENLVEENIYNVWKRSR